MKRCWAIMVVGLGLCAASFAGFYYRGTACCREAESGSQPELAWLKREFRLSDAEFARIQQLHAAYLPQCAARCQRIEEQSRRLRAALAGSTNLTEEARTLLAERAKLRAECEGEMLKHFLEVSRTMPAEQGRRYLSWVEEQTTLRGQAMEERHRQDAGGVEARQHHQH